MNVDAPYKKSAQSFHACEDVFSYAVVIIWSVLLLGFCDEIFKAWKLSICQVSSFIFQILWDRLHLFAYLEFLSGKYHT